MDEDVADMDRTGGEMCEGMKFRLKRASWV